MNYYFITLAIIVTVLVIWLFYRYIKTGIMLKKENESIKVGRDLRGRKVMLFCSWRFSVKQPPVLLGVLKCFSESFKITSKYGKIVKVWRPHYYRRYKEVINNEK